MSGRDEQDDIDLPESSNPHIGPKWWPCPSWCHEDHEAEDAPDGHYAGWALVDSDQEYEENAKGEVIIDGTVEHPVVWIGRELHETTTRVHVELGPDFTLDKDRGLTWSLATANRVATALQRAVDRVTAAEDEDGRIVERRVVGDAFAIELLRQTTTDIFGLVIDDDLDLAMLPEIEGANIAAALIRGEDGPPHVHVRPTLPESVRARLWAVVGYIASGLEPNDFLLLDRESDPLGSSALAELLLRSCGAATTTGTGFYQYDLSAQPDRELASALGTQDG